ncbi:MAG: VCBS repeat-containing protein, partial [Planctomycetes bacterium]|nr:VCBS repeat-containing protein [Planctomycetota bacterium]
MSRRRALLAACATVVLHLGAVPALTASTRDPDPDATFEFVPRLDTGLDFVQRSGTERQQYILEVKSTGVALLDFDRDGLLDICLTAGSTIEKQRAGEPGFGVRLYRNLGELRFADVTAQSGLGEFGWACGAAAADVDGNGWVDLLVTAYGPDRLFLNDAGHFTEVTDRAGLDRDGWSTSAAFADLDGDDDLDLFVARYLDFDLDHPPTHGEGFSCLWKEQVVMCGPRGLPAESDRLYRNRGDGTFEDVTEAWGIAAATPQYGLGVVIADFVGDSRPDIFVANDSSPNHLWENRGGRFEEVGFVAGVAYSADGQDQAGMGVGVADFDANGRWDLAVTNFADERNNLYLNQGDGTFFDEADRLRLGPAGQSALSWGIGCHDFDLDGRLDIFVANGHVYPQADHVKGTPGYAQKDHLFLGGPT